MISETLADRLAAFALSTRFEDLPEVVVAEAKRRLLDAFACAAGALGEPAPTIARGVAATTSGTPGGHSSAAAERRPTGPRSPTAFTFATLIAMTPTCRSNRRTRATTGPP